MRALLIIIFVLSINLIIGQTITDSLSNLEIVTIKADTSYLKYLKVYLPKNDVEHWINPDYIIPTEMILSERYKCNIKFMENSVSGGVNDPIFEVWSWTTNWGILFLHLTELEQLYQKGIVTEQVNLYGDLTDIMYQEMFDDGK